MAGFEFTSGGIAAMQDTEEGPAVFLDPQTNGEGGDPSGLPVPADPVSGIVPNDKLTTAGKAAPPALRQESPKDIVRLARRRAKELRALLKQAKRWEKELAELTRLIAAADGKPIAAVRNLDSSRRAS